MNTQNLFQLANVAKNCGDYDLANQIFAVLAYAVISGSNDVLIGYEQAPDQDDIVENLADPDGAGYYDLPFLFDSKDNYLCIPLPLVSRHFCNHIIWRCRRWEDREQGSHNRKRWRLQHSEERRAAASRDLWRRFYLEVSKEEADWAVAIILVKKLML